MKIDTIPDNTVHIIFCCWLPIVLLAIVFIQDAQAGTEVYITRDKNGNPVFSDQPSESAEKIKVQEIMTVPAENIPSKTREATRKPTVAYKSLSITRPLNDSAVRENSGKVSISVAAEPGLQKGHKIIISLDGSEISRGSSNSVSLDNVDRGTHSVSAAIISPEGTPLITAPPVQFTLLRFSQ